MRKCVFCEIIYKKGSKISFHRFPTDLTVRRIWLYNMKFFNWSPKENDALCSKHFDDACFIEHQNRRALKLGSVPTIFKENSEAMHTSTIIQNVASSSSAKRYSPCGAKKLIRLTNFEGHTPQAMHTSTIIQNVASSSSAKRYSPCGAKKLIRLTNFEGHTPQAMHTSTIIQNVASSSSAKRYSPCGAKKLIRVTNFEGHTPQDSSTAVSNDHNYESPQTLKKSRIEYGFAHDHQYGNSPKYQKKALEHHKKLLQDSLHKKTSKKHFKILEIKVEPHKYVTAPLSPSI